MAVVRSPRGLRLDSVVPLLLVLYLLFVVALEATGRVRLGDAVVMMAAPALAWVAIRAPAVLLVTFVAIPPIALTNIPRASLGPLTFLFAACLAAFIVLRGSLSRGLVATVAPIAALMVGALYSFNALKPSAHSAATEFRRALTLYLVLLALAYVLARANELTMDSIGWALLISTGISGIVFLWQLGFQPWNYSGTASNLEPGGLFYRTHFGYMMAIGFAVALARFFSKARADKRFMDGVVLAAFSALVAFSFTRGAWLIALLLLAGIPIAHRPQELLVAAPGDRLDRCRGSAGPGTPLLRSERRAAEVPRER